MPTIRIPGPLRGLTGGVAEVEVSAATVREALAQLERTHPGVAARLFDARGEVRPFLRIFVEPEDIAALAGLDTALTDRDVIAIVPAVAGGRDAG